MTKAKQDPTDQENNATPSQSVQRLLLRSEVMRLFGVTSRGTIDQMVEDEVLPPPVRIGKRNTAWPECEIIEVQRKMIKERDKLIAERAAAKAKQPIA